jgi:putative redox protein
MKIELRQISVSASETTIGKHKVTIDRPVSKGGSDAGPMGGELFLASVGGCFLSNLLAAVRTREADLFDIRVDVEATPEGTPPRFTALEIRVAAAGADQDQLPHLIEIADRGCIMMNTLRETVSVSFKRHEG